MVGILKSRFLHPTKTWAEDLLTQSERVGLLFSWKNRKDPQRHRCRDGAGDWGIVSSRSCSPLNLHSAWLCACRSTKTSRQDSLYIFAEYSRERAWDDTAESAEWGCCWINCALSTSDWMSVDKVIGFTCRRREGHALYSPSQECKGTVLTVCVCVCVFLSQCCVLPCCRANGTQQQDRDVTVMAP